MWSSRSGDRSGAAGAVAIAIVAGMLLGCQRPRLVPPAPPVLDRVVGMLDGMAETGDRTPLVYVRGHLQTMREQGDPRSAEWLEALETLAATGDPDTFRQRASALRDAIRAMAGGETIPGMVK